MRRVLCVLGVLCLLLVMPVYGAEVTSWDIDAVVAEDGEVTMAVDLIIALDGYTDTLVFPLGEGARKLTVNGVSMGIRRVDGVPSAVLENRAGFTGVLQFRLNYTLQNCLDTAGEWDLRIPLLAPGSTYTVKYITFRVLLPGEASLPAFESGYLGEDVDNYMDITVAGNEISATVDTTLRDHEELILTMKTDPAVFPRVGQALRLPLICMAGAGLAWVLGLAYWASRLRWPFFRTAKQPEPPRRIHPGQIRSCLFGQGQDIALTVLSWAQEGYLTIHLSRDGAVTLHKRKDMGTERGGWEGRWFRELFGRGRTAEPGSRRYRAFRAKAEETNPQVGKYFQNSGNPLVARGLCALSGGLLWALMGASLFYAGVIRLGAAALGGLMGLAASWLMQDAWKSAVYWDRRPAWQGLGAAAATLLLGILSGRMGAALLVLLGQAVMGLFVVFGGRRSSLGAQCVRELCSLRRTLKHMDAKLVNRMIRREDGYYYRIAAYALAFGVDKELAAAFARVLLPECPWLVTDRPREERTTQWYLTLRQVVQQLRQ